jgi:hypothetical protein
MRTILVSLPSGAGMVTDADEPCPACGAIDYDEYTPFETWRGGRSGPDAATIPNPVVSCRVCGQEEPEPTFSAFRSEPEQPENEAIRAARMAQADAQERKRRWMTDTLTLWAVRFPIYAVDGWAARVGGSGSQRDDLTEITIHHRDTPHDHPYLGNPPRLAVTTRREPQRSRPLRDARQILHDWIGGAAGAARPPDASHAAITLWLRAQARETRGAVLTAAQSKQPITIDGSPVMSLKLSGPCGRWVAVAHHADLTIAIAGHNLDPSSLRLEPIADPAAQLLGPEPPDA